MLFSCGPSVKEKEEIAVLTCNIMGETRNMDAAFRIKEINAAREQIGEDRFLGTDDEILDSFELGLCNELVLNDKKYETKLEDALSAKKDDAPPTRFIYDVPPSVEILFIVGLSEEISMNGSRIDISAVRENLEKIIAENPHHRHFGVICPGPEGTDFAIVDRLEDIAREAGASAGFAAC